MDFIPADHSATVKSLGPVGMANLMTRAAFRYRRTMSYFVRNRQFSDLGNFLFTKIILPTGEGSGELIYYAIGPLLQKFPQLVAFPQWFEVELTSKCNKRCIMCEHTWWHEPSKELSLDEFKHLADQFSNLHWVNLAGEGDSFLNKDFLPMLAYLRKRHVSVYLDDSLDLVTKDISYELVRLGIEGLYLSMDAATKETYESLKIGCNYDRTIEHLKELLDAKKELQSPLPEICVRFVVNKKNMYEMADVVEVLRKLGSRDSWGDGSKINFVGLLEYPQTRELIVEVFPQDQITKAIKAGQASGSLPVIFARSDTSTNPSINCCLAWMEPFFILVPQPTMLPCCAGLMSNNRAKLVEYGFGDYTKESVRSIWNRPYSKWFRKQVTKKDGKIPALCEGCRAYDTHERVLHYGVDRRKRHDFE